MDKWINHIFESSTTITKEFKEFARDFRRYIKKSLPVGLKLVEFSIGHFYLNGFIKKNDKFVYFSIMDVRHFPYSWIDNILIRKAKNEIDFSGMQNHYTHLDDFVEEVKKLL